MPDLKCRTFLRYTTGLAGTAVAGFAALEAWGRGRPGGPSRLIAAVGEGGYGRLEPAGPELALPAGFQYRRFGLAGWAMADGLPTPGAHDGMAAFPLPNGNLRLIRNHEQFLYVRDLPERDRGL